MKNRDSGGRLIKGHQLNKGRHWKLSEESKERRSERRINDGLTKEQRYRQRHPERVRETMRKYYQKNKGQFNKHYREHPEMWRAHNHVQQHPELRGSECELCGAREGLRAHHPDYDYPEIIVTSCSSCHNWIHKGVD